MHKQLQAQLAKQRALLRDLELLIDEEDRCIRLSADLTYTFTASKNKTQKPIIAVCSEALQHQLSTQLVHHKSKYEELQAGVRAQQLQVCS